MRNSSNLVTQHGQLERLPLHLTLHLRIEQTQRREPLGDIDMI